MLHISDREYRLLADYVSKNFGITLGEGKKTLVAGRLQNLLLTGEFRTFSDYYDSVLSDRTGAAASLLVDRITTNHTFFMREPDHFYYLKDTVLPLFLGTVKSKDLRIWSAGCSTGEEAYTLAMTLQDYFGEQKSSWDTKVLATDISGRVLEIARKGEYKDQETQALPMHWKIRYFQKINEEMSAVTNKIRSEVIFRLFNLHQPNFPFRKKFHVVFCRNVMIYFDARAKKELIGRFYDSMEAGGYLFLGHSEPLSLEETRFKPIRPAVYQRQ
jgi:chemotaxis protein methyltransferase CheR